VAVLIGVPVAVRGFAELAILVGLAEEVAYLGA
jgi:hypothetical protein